MKGRRLILLLLICRISSICLGRVYDQEPTVKEIFQHPINQFIINEKLTSEDANSLIFSEKFDQIITKLERVRSHKTSDALFLRTIFYRVHKNSLVDYDKMATMDETLKTGQFGCLTGTALYALILEHFGFNYDIIELTNHVYIQVVVNDRLMVMESTLPDEGLMKLNQELTAKTELDALDPRNIGTLITVGDGSAEEWNLVNGYNKITLTELSGLQYFNESVRLYTDKEYVKAMEMINEAYARYPSNRNEKLMQLVINKILKYDLIKEEVKNKYLTQYVKLVKRNKLSQTK